MGALCCCCRPPKQNDEPSEPLLGENKTPSLPTSTPPGCEKAAESYTAPQPAAVVGPKGQASSPGDASGGTATKTAVAAASGEAVAVAKPTGKESAPADKTVTPEGSGSVAPVADLQAPVAIPPKKDAKEAERASKVAVVADADQAKPSLGGEATKPIVPTTELPNGEDQSGKMQSTGKEQKADRKALKGATTDAEKDVPAAVQSVQTGVQPDAKTEGAGAEKLPEKKPTGLDVAVEEGLIETGGGNVGLKSHPIAVLDRTETSDGATMESHPIPILERTETSEEAAKPVEQVRALPESVERSTGGNEVTGSGDASGTGHRHKRRGHGAHGRGGARKGHGHKIDSNGGSHRGSGSGRRPRRARARAGHHS